MSHSSPAMERGPDHPVWLALSSYEIGPPDAALSFAQRLARENGWTLPYAQRVIGEYKRFCFLAVTTGADVTPSDAVDQPGICISPTAATIGSASARRYWAWNCIMGPRRVGQANVTVISSNMARTLQRYEAAFGPAPADIWPDARRRFLEDPKARRVHPRDGFVLPRRAVRLLSGLAVSLILFVAFLWWRL